VSLSQDVADKRRTNMQVQEALETARQPGIISCHCAPADRTPGDQTVQCAGRAMNTAT